MALAERPHPLETSLEFAEPSIEAFRCYGISRPQPSETTFLPQVLFSLSGRVSSRVVFFGARVHWCGLFVIVALNVRLSSCTFRNSWGESGATRFCSHKSWSSALV
jgi:hypothetical protein